MVPPLRYASEMPEAVLTKRNAPSGIPVSFAAVAIEPKSPPPSVLVSTLEKLPPVAVTSPKLATDALFSAALSVVMPVTSSVRRRAPADPHFGLAAGKK